jgi:hypothetical protein
MRVKWDEEEIRLLLSFYEKMKSGEMHKTNPLVIQASQEIRKLSINKEHSAKDPKFRNPNGIALKLANFLFLDPNYSGKGMKGCSELDKKIFNEFYMTNITRNVDIIYNEQQFPFKFYNWFSSMSGGVRRPLDEDSGRPLGNIIIEGQIHMLINEMINDYFHNKGKYVCVLVGGPGNGKTDIMEYASEKFVERFGGDWTKIKSELQSGFETNNRQSIVKIENETLLLTQDASQRDLNADSYIDSIYNDFEKIESFQNSLSIICMNRGILETIKKESSNSNNKLSKYQKLIKSIYQFNTLDASLLDLKIWGEDLDSKKLYTWSMDFDTLFSKVKDQNLDQNLVLSIFEKAKYKDNFFDDPNKLSPIFNANEFVTNKVKNLNLSKILRSYEILNGKRFTYREIFSLIGYLFYYSENELIIINKTNEELEALTGNQCFTKFEKLYKLYQYTCNYRFFNQFVQPTSDLRDECKKAFKDEKSKNLDVLFSVLSKTNKNKSASIPKFISEMEASFFDPILCSDNLTFFDDNGVETSIEALTKKVIYNLELNIENYSKVIPHIDRELINCLVKIKTEYCLLVTSDDLDVTKLNAVDSFKSFLNTTIIAFIKRGLFFSEYYIKDKLHIGKYLDIVEGDTLVKNQFVREFSKAMAKNGGANIETSLVTSIGQTPNQFKTNISIEARPYTLDPLNTPVNKLPSADQIILKYRVGSSSTDKYIVITYKLYREIMRSVERLLPGCLDQNFQLWKELKMSEISNKDDLKSSDTIKIDSIGEIKINARTPQFSYSLERVINI